MAQITFKGNPVNTLGALPETGAKAPDFRLTNAGLSDMGLDDFKGKIKLLNIVPSLDTSVCALSAKKFDKEAAGIDNLVVLTISCDLPFAQDRFCKTEGVHNVVFLSQMRDKSFGKDYKVVMTDGPLAGLLSRAVVVLDTDNRVVYTEQVPEIGQEPDYDKALNAVKKLT